MSISSREPMAQAWDRSKRQRVVLFLLLAGLLSAVCTVFFAALLDAGLILEWFFFGAAMSITLMKLKIFSERQAWHLFAVTMAASFFSSLVAGEVQFHIPLSGTEGWSMGHGEAVSPVSLFSGGLVGGFLLFGEALYLLHPRIRAGSLLVKAFLFSLVSGVLAVFGWMLGPYIGTPISRMFYVAMRHTAVPVPAPYDPLYGYRTPTVEFPVYLVWQVGMAFALAVMAQRSVAKVEQR